MTTDIHPALFMDLDAARSHFAGHMYVEDVTENEKARAAASELVAGAYRRFSSQGLEKDSVLAELCQDEYSRAGTARTFALYGLNPNHDQADIEMLGTIRMVLGTEMPNGMYPLEAMHLVSPLQGWERFTFADFEALKAVEYGRFVISPTCRNGWGRRLSINGLILRKLLIESFDVAVRRFGKLQAWAIMPSYVVNTVLEAGIPVLRAPGIEPEYHANRALFSKYDKYWFRSSPAYYKLCLDFVCDSDWREHAKNDDLDTAGRLQR